MEKNLVKFETHNEGAEAGGTSLQGYLNTDFESLCETFGEPMEGDGEKTDAEWEIVFENGARVTIYNWKNGKAYCGRSGTAVRNITEWNIGGYDGRAVEVIAQLFPYRTKKF